MLELVLLLLAPAVLLLLSPVSCALVLLVTAAVLLARRDDLDVPAELLPEVSRQSGGRPWCRSPSPGPWWCRKPHPSRLEWNQSTHKIVRSSPILNLDEKAHSLLTIRLGWDGNKTAADTKENLTFDLGDAALDAVDAAVAVQPDLERHRLLEKGRESLSVADQGQGGRR